MRSSTLLSALLAACGGSHWQNYLEDHRVEAARHEPESAVEVLALVREAAANGERIRAVGAGHSSSEVAQPSEGHEYVDVRRIHRPLRWDFLRGDLDRPERFVRVGAGATIEELNAMLAENGRALFNMGNYDAQTIAGAFSTGTHGSGLRHGPITERIAAIELVTDERHPESGERVQRLLRIEPTSGITDRAAFEQARAGHEDEDVRVMELEQDDEVFDAALVNLGCFGIIVAVTVETREPFYLEEDDTIGYWEGPGSIDLLAEAQASPEFLQITLIPHAILSGEHEGRVLYRTTRRVERPYAPPPHPERPSSRENLGRFLARISGTGLPENMGLFTPAFALEQIAGTFAAQADAPPWSSRSDRVLINSLAPDVHATSIDVQVPFETAALAFDRIVELARERGTVHPGPIHEEWWHTSPVGIRFVGRSRALLAPTHDGPRVSFEIPLLYDVTESSRTRAIHDQYREHMLHALETELTCDAIGGRPHWGQRNWMTGDRARRMYGDDWRRWVAQYERFNAWGTFSNAFTERMGLSGASPCNHAGGEAI